MSRPFFFILGLLLTALGIIGAFLPVMPTTVFLIGAVACFARSSPRLEHYLLHHPRFGASLRAWRQYGAVPKRAKMFACAGMTFGFLSFWIIVHPHWPLALLVAALMLACAAYVVSRPLPPSERG